MEWLLELLRRRPPIEKALAERNPFQGLGRLAGEARKPLRAGSEISSLPYPMALAFRIDQFISETMNGTVVQYLWNSMGITSRS